MGSRPRSPRLTTTTWLTPRRLLDALGPFDLDPCGAPDAANWPTAEVHYVWPRQDGLSLPWRGRVWLNPPYGHRMGLWLGRMSRHGRGTALVFARTETEAFQAHVFEGADAVLFLRGRLTFHAADGAVGEGNAGAPSVLAAYGPDDVDRLMASGLEGHVVGLRRPVLFRLAFEVDPPAPPQVWREVVSDAMRRLGGAASLKALYEALCEHPRSKANPNWRAKVRQTVGILGYRRVAAGQYEMTV